MPDINNRPLKLMKGCIIVAPDETDPLFRFDNKHGAIQRIWPDTSCGLAEVELDDGHCILVDGFKLIQDEEPKRKHLE